MAEKARAGALEPLALALSETIPGSRALAPGLMISRAIPERQSASGGHGAAAPRGEPRGDWRRGVLTTSLGRGPNRPSAIDPQGSSAGPAVARGVAAVRGCLCGPSIDVHSGVKDRSVARFGRIDRSVREVISRLHASLFACHHRLISGWRSQLASVSSDRSAQRDLTLAKTLAAGSVRADTPLVAAPSTQGPVWPIC
jgi:hypothetical protein